MKRFKERSLSRFQSQDDLIEKVVTINRCAKVVKGGRRFSFSALVVVGDGKGRVGYGFGKANDVAESIRKASQAARRSIGPIPLKGSTIYYETIGRHGAARVLLKPAGPGTGVIAGGSARAVLECAGVRDILTKSLGSANPLNVVRATLSALREMKSPAECLRMRGVEIDESE